MFEHRTIDRMECEVPLLMAFMRYPQFELDPPCIFDLKDEALRSEVARRNSSFRVHGWSDNGWIYYEDPMFSEKGIMRTNAQVWTGEGKRSHSSQTPRESFMGRFAPGTIDEDAVFLRVKYPSRIAYANRNNFYDPNDTSIDAVDMINRGVAWLIDRLEQPLTIEDN